MDFENRNVDLNDAMFTIVWDFWEKSKNKICNFLRDKQSLSIWEVRETFEMLQFTIIR